MTSQDVSMPAASYEEQLLRLRTLMLYGDLTPATARRLSEKLMILAESDVYPVRLFINSQKGCIDSAMYLYDMLQFACKQNLYTIGTGVVAGPALLLFATPPRERRYALTYTRFHLNQSSAVSMLAESTAVSEEKASGAKPSAASQSAASAVTSVNLQAAKLKNHMVSILSWQTGQPVDRIEKDTQADVWLSAKESVNYGLSGQIVVNAHEIVMPKKI